MLKELLREMTSFVFLSKGLADLNFKKIYMTKRLFIAGNTFARNGTVF